MPSSKAIPNSILVLRIITLLSLVGSGVLLVLDNFTLEDGTETHFYDILSFRFMLSTAAIGAAYTLFQLPFVLAAPGGFPESELDEAQSKNSSFFDKAIIATGILLFGAVCMSVVSVLSSIITRTSNRGYFG
ncbi:hypothetical protein COP1_015994 [Malus domestica]